MKTTFTNITLLPSQVSREVAIAMLHDHGEMIRLNPLVIEHHSIPPPTNAPKDEIQDCQWEEIVDRIPYGAGVMSSKVKYRGCFYDLNNGLQTHVYAPLNLSIREKWTIEGTMPGEPDQPQELGLNTPRRGLYLREEGEMKCNILMTSFVRKNLDSAHKTLVERILAKTERIQRQLDRNSVQVYSNGSSSLSNQSLQSTPRIEEHVFHIIHHDCSPGRRSLLNKPLPLEPLNTNDGNDLESAIHPALRVEYRRSIAHDKAAIDSSLPTYHSLSYQVGQQYSDDLVKQSVQRLSSTDLQASPALPMDSPTLGRIIQPGNMSDLPPTFHGHNLTIEENAIVQPLHLRSQSQPVGFPAPDSDMSFQPDRISMVSKISGVSPSKSRQDGSDTDEARYSLVSNMTDAEVRNVEHVKYAKLQPTLPTRR